ncbi:MAG: hypothetical protein EPN46_04735 [Candidimonas sp.]|nr:MAG: hypothetical protein EPN46_04735 [Candidimonas sp.]
MVIDMQEESLDSIERLEQFLEGTAGALLDIRPKVNTFALWRYKHIPSGMAAWSLYYRRPEIAQVIFGFPHHATRNN